MQLHQCSIFCKTPPRAAPVGAHREADTFVPQPRAVTFSIMIQLFKSKA